MRTRLILFAAMAGLFLGFWLFGGERKEALPLEWSEYVEGHLAPAFPAESIAQFPFGGSVGGEAKVVRRFRERGLLGEQWKPREPVRGKSEKVRAIGSGLVLYAEDLLSEWGKVALVLHVFGDGGKRVAVESLYAHLGTLEVQAGDWVERGQVLGTWSHDLSPRSPGFYWEVRRQPGLLLGPGESEEAEGWTSPSGFVRAWRDGGSHD
jgi:murein DD-endopeptidase MepM/ murein hydrolase activator NlpD